MRQSFVKSYLRKRKALAADPKICSGCQVCQVVCSMTHGRSVDLERSRIYLRSNPFKGSFNPIICHQCTDFPCLKACPESAIQIDEKDGAVLILDEKCSGCRSCEKACPFKAIRFDHERNKAFKCDLCKGEPECVKWCPTRALGITEYGGDLPL